MEHDSPDAGSSLDRFKRLVGEGSLYASSTFSDVDADMAAMLIGIDGLRIDLYCPKCRAPSTFQYPPVKTDGVTVFDPYKPPPTSISPGRQLAGISTAAHLKYIALAMGFLCARNSSHRVEFILRVQENVESSDAPTSKGTGVGARLTVHSAKRSYTFVKIGQFPPHAELVAGRLKTVSKIAGKLDMTELRRAVGLISHDAAIGAFVYLRRVFERLIAQAWQSAVDAGETLPDSTGLRMTEKIAALKNHLPDIVVQNAKVYGILSLGLHELTEEECGRTYPLVEESVIAMLEEAHSHAEKRKRETRIGAELAKLSGELGKNSAADS